MVRTAKPVAMVTGYHPPAPPAALIVTASAASFAATVVNLGMNIEQAYRALDIEQARARQRRWAKEGRASVVLVLDSESEHGDEDEALARA